ncbi:START domain-containing protein [Hahella ganghwensis]|uniref:START domain-containing protein n=1 Tax=Hahella ganghwensis TaxID=286420 RepID=UPI0003A67784|nr:START domain-containing protein [Hahella ganghwensis]
MHAESNLDPHDPSWSLQKDQDGIQVYFKQVTGSSVKAFMGKAVMSASMSSILKVMQEAETCVEWVEGCAHAQTLEGGGFREFYQYAVNNLPWPANDRDYVIKVQANDDPDTGIVEISLQAVEGLVPETRNTRLKNMDIRYTLNPLDDEHTAITWVQHTEPGGFIPGWLVNMLLLDIPYYSLTRLEQVANRPEYRTAKFVYNEQNEIVGFE